jgi:hypothetical protein
MTTTAQYPTKVGGETVQWDAQGAFIFKFGKRIEVKLPPQARPKALATVAERVTGEGYTDTEPVDVETVTFTAEVKVPELAPKSYQETSKLEDVVLALRAKLVQQDGQIAKAVEDVRLLTIEVKRLTGAVAKLSSPAGKAEQKWPDGEPMATDVVDMNGNYVEAPSSIEDAPEDDGAPPIEL